MLTLDQKAITRDKRILQRTKVAIGETLNNGTTLLAETDAIRFPSEVITTVVLAVGTGYQPFIVWTRCRDQAQFGDADLKPDAAKYVDYCIQGHYFHNLDDALFCFTEEQKAVERKAAERNQLTVAELSAELNNTLREIAERKRT